MREIPTQILLGPSRLQESKDSIGVDNSGMVFRVRSITSEREALPLLATAGRVNAVVNHPLTSSVLAPGNLHFRSHCLYRRHRVAASTVYIICLFVLLFWPGAAIVSHVILRSKSYR